MTPNDNFWTAGKTDKASPKTWFASLPPLRKITYLLLLLFVITWCFYSGFALAGFLAPEWDESWIADAGDYVHPEVEPEAYEVVRLTGSDVILLVGADKRPGEKTFRTDTIMLAFVDWQQGDIKLLSIPRDSYAQLAGTPTKTKINEAFFYGGITMLRNTIEYTFGIDVEHYVQVDFEGFQEIIDLFGGVEIDVPQDMYNRQEGIDLQAGLQKLDGEAALGFVRYRDRVMADIGRIERQQLFLQALASTVAQSSLLPKVPQLIPMITTYCTTDYSLTDMSKMALALRQLDLQNIEMYSLPGNGMYIGAINYWMLDQSGVAGVIQQIIGADQTVELRIASNSNATRYPVGPAQEEEEEPEEELPEEGEAIPATDTPTEDPASPGETTEPPSDDLGEQQPPTEEEPPIPPETTEETPPTPPEQEPATPPEDTTTPTEPPPLDGSPTEAEE